MTKKNIVGIIIILILAAGGFAAYIWFSCTAFFCYITVPLIVDVQSFEECVAAGNGIMESYPPKCRTKDGQMFTQDIGNELEKQDLIRVDTPRPNQLVQNHLQIKGEVRGTWFFEASFSAELLDGNGKKIGGGIMQAKGEWMTENFVPFEGMLMFEENPSTKKGTLVLKKDNPSGLPELDDELRIPVVFSQ